MNYLTLDTCFNKSYIVLGNETDVIQSKIIESDEKNYHSAYVIPVLRDILVKNHLYVKDIDVMGINIGPGSFTGVRAGVTIARVLCQQFNIKLIGVSSLEILSYINKNKTHTTVVLDARKNKVYFGEYENGFEITNPCLIDKENLSIKKNSVVIADNSIHNIIDSINYEQITDNFGIYLYNIVKNKLNDEGNWAKVKPLYIQKPSITKPKERGNVL